MVTEGAATSTREEGALGAGIQAKAAKASAPAGIKSGGGAAGLGFNLWVERVAQHTSSTVARGPQG